MGRVPRICHQLGGDAFLTLSATQELVVSRAQLALARVGRQLISRRIVAGEWQAIGPYVVVLRPGPLSRDQQLWAGVLHAGDDGVLAGLSALEVAGFRGFSDEAVSVCAPHGRNRPDLLTDRVSVRVHETRSLPPAQVLAHARPPRTTQDRATVDAASAAVSDRACRTILAMSVQQRLTTPATLRPLVLPRTNLRRRALILETLDDVEGGSQSLPELEYLRGLRHFGLPVPTRQCTVRRPDGRYYLDAEFDLWAVTVEINGAHHLDVRHKEADDVRRTRLAIGGRLMVDIGSYIVRHDIALAALLTADALLSRGWEPPPEVRDRLAAVARGHPSFTWTTSPTWAGGSATRSTGRSPASAGR